MLKDSIKEMLSIWVEYQKEKESLQLEKISYIRSVEIKEMGYTINHLQNILKLDQNKKNSGGE